MGERKRLANQNKNSKWWNEVCIGKNEKSRRNDLGNKKKWQKMNRDKIITNETLGKRIKWMKRQRNTQGMKKESSRFFLTLKQLTRLFSHLCMRFWNQGTHFDMWIEWAIEPIRVYVPTTCQSVLYSIETLILSLVCLTDSQIIFSKHPFCERRKLWVLSSGTRAFDTKS